MYFIVYFFLCFNKLLQQTAVKGQRSWNQVNSSTPGQHPPLIHRARVVLCVFLLWERGRINTWNCFFSCRRKEEEEIAARLFSLSVFSAPFSLFVFIPCLCLTRFLSSSVSLSPSLALSLLSLLFILSLSFTYFSLHLQLLIPVYSLPPSLPGRRRDDGFVAVVTPSFSLPLLAPAASPNDDTQIQQFSHVEMI